MIPRIKSVEAMKDLKLLVSFDDGVLVLYDVSEDVNELKEFLPLRTEIGLFENFQLDESRTCITWSEQIDLPSDTIFEYGRRVEK